MLSFGSKYFSCCWNRAQVMSPFSWNHHPGAGTTAQPFYTFPDFKLRYRETDHTWENRLLYSIKALPSAQCQRYNQRFKKVRSYQGYRCVIFQVTGCFSEDISLYEYFQALGTLIYLWLKNGEQSTHTPDKEHYMASSQYHIRMHSIEL